MTNVERLQEWIDEQGEGLLEVSLFLNPLKESNVEEICGSVLEMLDKKAKGEYTTLASVINT